MMCTSFCFRSTARWAAAAGALLLLAACGQKGPLYLPQEPPATQRATLPQALFRPIRPAAAEPTPPAQDKKTAPARDTND